jgi:hypothetical protein
MLTLQATNGSIPVGASLDHASAGGVREQLGSATHFHARTGR